MICHRLRWFSVSALLLCSLVSGCDEDGVVDTGFSGDRALEHATNIVNLGPRPAGSEALEKSREMIERSLAKSGWATKRQSFSARTPIGRVKMTNLRARFGGGADNGEVWDRSARVVVACHYDTKLYEDIVFVGANDGGSGCGLLLELASLVASKFPQVGAGVELVFFDGEEAVEESITYAAQGGFDQQTGYDGLYGSHYYARMLRLLPRKQWPEAVVVVDMIGDKDLNIEIPTNCNAKLIAMAVDAADQVGVGEFVTKGNRAVIDDHVPFHLLGIPVVNLIDFDFEPWHTEDDVLTTISGKSLGVSGAVVVRFLQNFLLHGSE